MLDPSLPTYHIHYNQSSKLSHFLLPRENLPPEVYTIKFAYLEKYILYFALLDPFIQDILYTDTTIGLLHGPYIPKSFTLHLYNPPQNVLFVTKLSPFNTINSIAFSLTQSSPPYDPDSSHTTITRKFQWKRSAIPRLFSTSPPDWSCLLTSTNLSSRDPDIPIAQFRSYKKVSFYQSNIDRIDLSDTKALELLLLLSAVIIRHFNSSSSIPPTNTTPLLSSPSSSTNLRNNQVKNDAAIAHALAELDSPSSTPPLP